MNRVSVFENINETKRPYFVSIDYAIARIKNGKSQDRVNQIRSCSTKDERNKMKMNLPCICFSGIFSERKKIGITQHSGYICLDFDHVDDLFALKDELVNDPYIFACWISPSGEGIKALVKIPDIIEKHELFFDALKRKYPHIDASGRDISRVCYESYDPDIYINTSSLVWDTVYSDEAYDFEARKPQIPLTDEGEIITRVIKWMDNRGELFTNGSRNAWILKVAGAMNRYGVSEYTAINHLLKYQEDTFKAEEIKKTVRNAYKDKANHGISYFENTDVKQDIKKHLKGRTDKQTIISTIVSTAGISQDEASKVVDTVREELNERKETFWDVTYKTNGDVMKIEINRQKFINFLQFNGFFRYRVSQEYIIYVRIIENQVEEIQLSDVKNFVFIWITQLEDKPFDGIDKHFLYEFMARGIKTYFSKDLLDLLKIVDIKLNNDTETSAFFYFINEVVEVTKDEIKLIHYSDLPGKVWKRHIIQRSIVISDSIEQNTYSKFLGLIITTPEDLISLASVIGYLLHRYKDKKISKAPILTDSQSNDNPEGGSGKGLIIDGIRQLRNVVTIDGKNFSSGKNFAFQRIEVDTELIFIDDVPRGFQFENLFSIITEGITVEKKNKPEYFIPFDRSPKIAIATNYYLRGDGSSNDRRKVDIEINNYFTATYTPFDEFGITLFHDWDNDTWNDFDNTMIFYCQRYLQHGIIPMSNESIKLKKLTSNTSSEFLEYVESIPINEEVNRKDIMAEFINLYPSYRKLTSKTFIKWINTWCNAKGYDFDKDYRRSHNDFFIFIHDRNSEIKRTDDTGLQAKIPF